LLDPAKILGERYVWSVVLNTEVVSRTRWLDVFRHCEK